MRSFRQRVRLYLRKTSGRSPDVAVVIEAVIFDVDGTLVDSVDLHARAWIEAFRDYGIEIKFENVRRQIGKGGDQIVRMFLSDQQMANFGEHLSSIVRSFLKSG